MSDTGPPPGAIEAATAAVRRIHDKWFHSDDIVNVSCAEAALAAAVPYLHPAGTATWQPGWRGGYAAGVIAERERIRIRLAERALDRKWAADLHAGGSRQGDALADLLDGATPDEDLWDDTARSQR